MKSMTLYFGIYHNQSVRLRTWSAPFSNAQKDFSEVISFIKEKHKSLTGEPIKVGIIKQDETRYKFTYGSEHYAYFLKIEN